MIELRDVYKIYSDGDSEIRALDGINLHIAEKEFVAIVGQSGSGKSTLAKAIMKLVDSKSGQILINGQNILNI